MGPFGASLATRFEAIATRVVDGLVFRQQAFQSLHVIRLVKSLLAKHEPCIAMLRQLD